MSSFPVNDVSETEISVIGGAGHVGLPLSILLASSGFSVNLIDKNEERLAEIANGKMPFNEPGGEKLLNDALDENRLHLDSNFAPVRNSDVVIIVIGTPIDEHHNPQIDPLLALVDNVTEYLTKDKLLVFRSTVYPGTTSMIADRLEKRGYTIGEDLFISFAPERIAQHKAFEEAVNLPQLIGSFDDESYSYTKAIFNSFLEAECLKLRPTEAELGKLFTNMWRYLTFAAANEFYLIADTFANDHDVNINKILDKTSSEYPRFDVPSPGANVGGPCLTKDGWFLVDNVPYNELVSSSYQINEGIPAQIIERMDQMKSEPQKIGILGMTFKPNSDDTRNSVSFKLQKQLQLKGYTNVFEIEPNGEEFGELQDISGCDWIILMTPHEEFENISKISNIVSNNDALYCDIWGFWEEMRHQSDNGYFFGNELS